MPDSTFRFLEIRAGQSKLYQVRLDSPAGRLVGTVAPLDGGWWQATVVVAGKLHTQPFNDRTQAAKWLLGLAPKQRRTRA